MMQYRCDVIKDLLPLYADEVCSEESRKAVAEHISGCSTCRNMLEKMNQQLVVNVNTDISTLKRIQKRIWIERVVIGLLLAGVLAFGGFLGSFYLLDTDRTMDYEKHNLAENIYAEEDEDGNVWLVKQGTATEAWYLMANARDAHGEYMLAENGMPNENYNNDEKNGWGFTLKERKIDALYSVTMDPAGYSEWAKERTMILDANKMTHQKIDEIYYYDDTTDTEYLLWKRGE